MLAMSPSPTGEACEGDMFSPSPYTTKRSQTSRSLIVENKLSLACY